MNVGLIVPGWARDDADVCLPVAEDVIHALGDRARVRVLALRYPFEARTYHAHDADVRALAGGDARGLHRVPLLLRAVRALHREHRRQPFDVLHGLWADEPGAVATIAGKVLGVPSVVSIMGGELVRLPDIDYGGHLSRVNHLLTRIALRGATRVTAATSEPLRAVTPSRGAVLVWGVDPALFARDGPRQTLRGEFRILHVGSLVPVKDHALLLQAFEFIHRQAPGAHLHLVGEGPLRLAIERQIEALGFRDAVTLHGHVPRAELGAYYRAAHVLAISSRHEAQPAVLLEAMLCGLPVVGTRVGLATELAQSCTRAVPPGEPHALSCALLSLHEPHERAALAATTEATVRHHYLAGHTAEQLCMLYHSILPNTSRAAQPSTAI